MLDRTSVAKSMSVGVVRRKQGKTRTGVRSKAPELCLCAVARGEGLDETRRPLKVAQDANKCVSGRPAKTNQNPGSYFGQHIGPKLFAQIAGTRGGGSVC